MTCRCTAVRCKCTSHEQHHLYGVLLSALYTHGVLIELCEPRVILCILQVSLLMGSLDYTFLDPDSNLIDCSGSIADCEIHISPPPHV